MFIRALPSLLSPLITRLADSLGQSSQPLVAFRQQLNATTERDIHLVKVKDEKKDKSEIKEAQLRYSEGKKEDRNVGDQAYRDMEMKKWAAVREVSLAYLSSIEVILLINLAIVCREVIDCGKCC